MATRSEEATTTNYISGIDYIDALNKSGKDADVFKAEFEKACEKAMEGYGTKNSGLSDIGGEVTVEGFTLDGKDDTVVSLEEAKLFIIEHGEDSDVAVKVNSDCYLTAEGTFVKGYYPNDWYEPPEPAHIEDEPEYTALDVAKGAVEKTCKEMGIEYCDGDGDLEARDWDDIAEEIENEEPDYEPDFYDD